MIVLKDVFIGDFPKSQKFGENPSMYAQFGLNGHNGIDWAVPNGTKLVSCFDNAEVITAADDGNGYGKHVKLWDKSQGVVAIYGHLQEILVSSGQQVTFGQLLGLSDNTGFSTGPHLHFGVCKVDEACTRLNKDNGYQGWINPFDGRIFTWNVKNLSEPIGPEPETLSQDSKNALALLLDYQKSQNLGNLEGTARFLVGAAGELANSLKSIQSLKQDLTDRENYIQGQKATINDLQESQGDLAEKLGCINDISFIKGEIEKLIMVEDELDDTRRKLEAKDKEIEKLKKAIETDYIQLFGPIYIKRG